MNRTLLLSAALAVLTLPAATSAQDPYGDYNRARAYAHYTNSQALVKSFSSLDAARVMGYDTPFESARFYQSPGYYREQSSARYGRSYYSDPGTTSSLVMPRYPYPGNAEPGYYDPNLGYPSVLGTDGSLVMPQYPHMGNAGPGYYDPNSVYSGVQGMDPRFGAYPWSPAARTPYYGTPPVLSTGPGLYPPSYYPRR